ADPGDRRSAGDGCAAARAGRARDRAGGEPVTREPEIALVLSAEAWVDDLHRHCADHGGARVRCLVLDPAVALDKEFDVLVTGERWPALTRPFVDALHERGRR